MRMRSLSYLFFLFLFTLCAWFGFGAAGQVSQSMHATTVQAAPAGQSNYLLVSLDSAKGSPARLSSAWLALVKRDSMPTIVFKKVYPQPGSGADWQDVEQGFDVVQNGVLPQAFEQKIAGLHLPISATLLLDSDLLPALGGRLGVSLPSSQSITGNRQPSAASETAQLKALCKLLSGAPRLKSGPGSLKVSATHWMDPWKGLVTSLRFTSCEVLVGP